MKTNIISIMSIITAIARAAVSIANNSLLNNKDIVVQGIKPRRIRKHTANCGYLSVVEGWDIWYSYTVPNCGYIGKTTNIIQIKIEEIGNSPILTAQNIGKQIAKHVYAKRISAIETEVPAITI